MPSHIQGNGDHSGGEVSLGGSGIFGRIWEKRVISYQLSLGKWGYIYTREEPDWSGKMGSSQWEEA